MQHLIFPTDCGNSPKSLAVIDFYKSLFAYDTEAVAGMVSDDFTYAVHGLGVYEGREGLRQLMEEMKNSTMQRLEVTNVLSHGKYVAAHGNVSLTDGSGLAFGEFFTFSGHSKNARIVRVDSYTVTVPVTLITR